MNRRRKRAPASNMVTRRKPRADAVEKEGEMESCTDGFDVFRDACPARTVLDHLSDKWALLILDCLRSGPVRFNSLRREIDGISQKVLSQVLKRLQRDGLLTRTAYPTVPVTVEYALTELGRDLTCKVRPLLVWAEENMPAIQEAQVAYDAAESAAIP